MMKNSNRLLYLFLIFLTASPLLSDSLPWRDAGWTEREAAAHLLDRFAFGARPGEVDRVVDIGLDVWLERQLAADLDDRALETRWKDFHSLELSTREIREIYPTGSRVLREAQSAGVIDELPDFNSGEDRARPDRASMRNLRDFAEDRGYRPLPELLDETAVQKLYRAIGSENQLQEVLTDFWFNHFNVSITDPESQQVVLAYERDAVRPFVLGRFEDMLRATAQHPAMLVYLDNAFSVADEGVRTLPRPDRQGRRGARFAARDLPDDPDMRRQIEERRPTGLNENYARELLELHTLGVDGGYTQDDVIAVARAFTGWTVYPEGPRGERVRSIAARAQRRPGAAGHFVFTDSFFFRADAHDAEKKIILGRKFRAGRGMDEGLEVLRMLAEHPSTARHLSRKLAIRFVSDDPPQSLVDRLAARFSATDGDLKAVIRTLAESPEFWNPEARRSKIKSPFEVAVSAVRGLDAEVTHPFALLDWITEMGQPLYAYQAPTGYPDRADAWVNTGSLTTRMNFSLMLATQRISGVRFDPSVLGVDAKNAETNSERREALTGAFAALLPGRDPSTTIERLLPMLEDPALQERIASFEAPSWTRSDERDRRRRFYRRPPAPRVRPDDGLPAQVLGLLLGSPEFQRR